MKKLFAAVVFMISALFLISCSNQQSLDGEYYWINEHRNEVKFIINGKTGEWRVDEHFDITDVDTEKKQFTYRGSLNSVTVNYKLSENGELTFKNYTYYKKDSEAYKDALKKYGYKEKD